MNELLVLEVSTDKGIVTDVAKVSVEVVKVIFGNVSTMTRVIGEHYFADNEAGISIITLEPESKQDSADFTSAMFPPSIALTIPTFGNILSYVKDEPAYFSKLW